MKIKISKLLDMKPVIEKLVEQDVPVSAGYDLMKIVKTFDIELELYTKAKKKLFDKYGKEDKEKKSVSIPKEKVEAFKKDLEKLLDKEIKLEVTKIKVSSLGNTVKLSTIELLKIDLIIER